MFAKPFNVKKITLLLIGLAVFVMSLYFLASHAIFAYRMSNIRKSYMESYAGCEMKSFHQGIVENMNKNWKKESEDAHFNHEDVVEYMMQHCPPKSDDEIEAMYSYLLDGTDYYPDMDEKQEGLERIENSKKVRDYKFKFIDKKFDVFHE